jgi:hypothetical protein
MKLRCNQICPIHRSRFCCGREGISKQRAIRQLGVRRIEDPHHPRGYGELRSNVEMRKLLDKKIVAHPENIQAVHWWCNGEKGSSRA